MKFTTAIAVMLTAMFAIGTVNAKNDELPNGKPFVLLESNMTVLAEAIDDLYQQIETLEARIAELEAGGVDYEAKRKAACLQQHGKWYEGKAGYPGKCVLPAKPAPSKTKEAAAATKK